MRTTAPHARRMGPLFGPHFQKGGPPPTSKKPVRPAQKADNAGDNEEENRANHDPAHSAEQHDGEIGLTKQHSDRQGADEATKDASDPESPGKPDVISPARRPLDLRTFILIAYAIHAVMP
jgi:hypothetical protein